jgi:hypothetical protein
MPKKSKKAAPQAAPSAEPRKIVQATLTGKRERYRYDVACQGEGCFKILGHLTFDHEVQGYDPKKSGLLCDEHAPKTPGQDLDAIKAAGEELGVGE